METVDAQVLSQVFPERPSQSHKGQYGRLLVIGGSYLYTGAPTLTGMAALRSGCDLVTIAAPERPAQVAAHYSPDLITYPLNGKQLAGEHVTDILSLTETVDAVVIGNGISRQQHSMDALYTLLTHISVPVVLDAAAIHAFASHSTEMDLDTALVTAHAQEYTTLTGTDLTKMALAEQTAAVQESADAHNITLLVKGTYDIIADREQVAVNETGNAFMTVGGTGDVLAGIAGSVLAQGNDPFDAACAAAWLNGRTGEVVAKEKKQGLIASDLIEQLCRVLK